MPFTISASVLKDSAVQPQCRVPDVDAKLDLMSAGDRGQIVHDIDLPRPGADSVDEVNARHIVEEQRPEDRA
jgi:hypothetical protein